MDHQSRKEHAYLFGVDNHCPVDGISEPMKRCSRCVYRGSRARAEGYLSGLKITVKMCPGFRCRRLVADWGYNSPRIIIRLVRDCLVSEPKVVVPHLGAAITTFVGCDDLSPEEQYQAGHFQRKQCHDGRGQ